MSSQNPPDPSKNHPDKIASNNKVIVLSVKNMHSFKYDPSKGFLTANQSESSQQVFMKTQQQQSSSSQPRVQVSQTNPIGTSGTILIRAPTASTISKSQFTSITNHPNVKIQENERKVIAVRNSPSSRHSLDNPVLISGSKQIGATQIVSKVVKAPSGTIILSQPPVAKNSIPITMPSGIKGITITPSPNVIEQSASKVPSKPVLIRPKPDPNSLVIDPQILTPRYQLVSQAPPGLTTLSQFKTTNLNNFQISQPAMSKMFSAPVPALTLIQPKPQTKITNEEEEDQSTEEYFVEKSQDEKRIVVKKIEDQNRVADNSELTEIDEAQDEDSPEQCESQEYESSSSMLLCDERIVEVSPNDSEKAKTVEVTPEKSDDEAVTLTVLEVKKNLGREFSVECDKENVDIIIEEQSESENSSMTDIRQHKVPDYEESLSRSEIAKSVSETTSSPVPVKSKRTRKPKNPTIIASLGLPFKPSQSLFRKSKVEKKLEFELDFHDPINKIQWEDGIGGLNNCNKLFGFDEFGLIEVLNKEDARAKLNQIDVKEVVPNGNYKLRKITDPIDRFTCTVCTKIGTIRDFYSPECCSESCLAITKRKSNETGSSVGRESGSSESGLTTPVDERRLIFGGEAIPLQQLQQHLLEQQLPSKRRIVKKRTEVVSDQKFQWDTYLSAKSVPAPLQLFKSPYPSIDNPFKVGMKLEAIDPENQKMFCVCTVEEKLGFRIKLHFDGYPNHYDFWVNADSPNIFPSGFCQSTNRSLQTPPKWNNKKFDWSEYLDFTNSIGAQKNLFPHILAAKLNDDKSFEIGMKLETTCDGKIYAGSIIDKIGDRVLISHDGHEELRCAWFDIRSPYLHPCNYHKTLEDPECFIPPCRPFDWKNYLSATKSKEAPAKVLFFAKRKPLDFEPGSKLEIVDCVNRQLIRPATVLCRKDYKIQVIFDGFNISFAFWVDDDSDDIHPINWCEKTNHPIEHPAGFNKSQDNCLCPSSGCRGIGNAKHRDRHFHDSVTECPYEGSANWKKVVSTKQCSHLDYKPAGKRGRPPRKEAVANGSKDQKVEVPEIIDFEDEIPRKAFKLEIGTKWGSKTESKRKSQTTVVEEEVVAVDPKTTMPKDFIKDYGPQINYSYNLWKKNSEVLDRAVIDDEFTGNPMEWNVENVCSFIRRLLDDAKTVEKFREHDIDGAAFVSMCQDDLINLMDIKLGAAVKIYNRILHLRQEIMLKFLKI